MNTYTNVSNDTKQKLFGTKGWMDNHRKDLNPDFDERSLELQLAESEELAEFPIKNDLDWLKSMQYCKKSKDPEVRKAIEALDLRKRQLRG